TAEEGGGGVPDAALRAAGVDESACGADQPRRVDLGVAADVNVELLVVRAQAQAAVPTRFKTEALVRLRARLRFLALGAIRLLGGLFRTGRLAGGRGRRGHSLHLLGRQRGAEDSRRPAGC